MPSRLRLAGCLLLAAFALRTDAAPSKSSARTALIIGNAKYEASIGPLRNTGNDAKAVAKTLRELGFAVIEKHDVTRDQLLRAVVEFRATLTGRVNPSCAGSTGDCVSRFRSGIRVVTTTRTPPRS